MSYIDEQQFKVRGDDLVKACSTVDALRLALAASRDEAEKVKAERDDARRIVANLEEEASMNRGLMKLEHDSLAAECAALRAAGSAMLVTWGSQDEDAIIKARNGMIAAIDAARADAARKEPPAKAHGCEVGE